MSAPISKSPPPLPMKQTPSEVFRSMYRPSIATSYIDVLGWEVFIMGEEDIDWSYMFFKDVDAYTVALRLRQEGYRAEVKELMAQKEIVFL